MTHRFGNAVKTFSSILLYFTRTRQFHVRSYQYDYLQKRNEHIYALLAICLVLAPQRVDEQLHIYLRDRYSEVTLKMQQGFFILPFNNLKETARLPNLSRSFSLRRAQTPPRHIHQSAARKHRVQPLHQINRFSASELQDARVYGGCEAAIDDVIDSKFLETLLHHNSRKTLFVS